MGEDLDDTRDVRVIDVQMRDQAHAGQIADAGTDARLGQKLIEFAQMIARHLDENHVGMAGFDLYRPDFTQTSGKALRARVILGESLDMMVERVQSGRSQHSALAHAAAKHLAPTPGRGDQGFRAKQDRSNRCTKAFGQAYGDRVERRSEFVRRDAAGD